MEGILGIDIGGTKCTVVVGYTERKNQEYRLDIAESRVLPTEVERGVQYTLDKIIETAHSLLRNIGNSNVPLSGIGISCGGPLDSGTGVIMSPPNLYGWDNISIVDIFAKQFGVKAKLQNDANACALAEWRFGAARGCTNVIYLTFGTGMGAGIILNGNLYSGTNDLAGEVGHIRMNGHGPAGYGKEGSFEGFCSGGGIAQLGRSRALALFQQGKTPLYCHSQDELIRIDAKGIADAVRNGDADAQEIFTISGTFLGRGLALLIDLLNPEVIVIGGIFSRCRDLLWPRAREELEKESLSLSNQACRIVPAELGEYIGVYAPLSVYLFA